MEIFMRDIAFSVTKNQLKIEIARAIHSPDYAHHSTQPLNLEVFIIPQRRNARGRCAKLTLPTVEVGEQFLREYGEPSPSKVIHIGTRIKFSLSHKAPLPDVLEEIQRLPFLDPRAAEEQESRNSELRHHVVSVKLIQFGWECRDSTFSPEYDLSCIGNGRLMFDGDRREFRIEITGQPEDKIIAIRAAQVWWTSAGFDSSGIPAIFFYLHYAPSYETRPWMTFESLLQSLSLTQSNAPIVKRQRWSAIDCTHEGVAPFTSTFIRLECEKRSDLETFRHLGGAAHLKVDDYLYPVARRGLFSEGIRQEYSAWVTELNWRVAFQIEALTRDLLVDLTEILALRPNIEQLIRLHGEDFTVEFLRHFSTQAKAWFYPDESHDQITAMTIQELWTQCRDAFVPPSRSRLRNPDLLENQTFNCLHVVITPTTMSLQGPFPERSNRVMRSYPDHHDSFLRVSFVDETNLQYRFDREIDGQSFIKRRVGKILSEGLLIAGRQFQFLAYSQSALKEHAVWFVKEFRDTQTGNIVNASSIIQGLGNFNARDPKLIYCPARYGARISQAFTATDPSVTVEAEEVFEIDDIKTSDEKWCFTDGVGTISPELAREIWKELCARRRRGRRAHTYPRAFQVRFMGSKGMLSVDYLLTGRAICLTDSMIKFDAPNSREIEIARAFDRPGPFYLNRPLIMILEDLGVPYETFHSLQSDAVQDAQQSVESLARSAKLLERFGLGASYRLTSVMLSLDKLGVGPLTGDKFWQQMMDFSINHVLRELKHHARIPVPNAWNVVGVADVHGWLQEGEIFVHIVPQNGAGSIYLEGPTLVTRSPTIHRGDVQVANAIGRPPPGSPFERESLRNCVVFSTKGARPLPSYLGGGDLDGDVYCCTTLPSLRPRRTYPPADYDPAKRMLLDRPSTMQDVADFFTEYINSDSLGMIAVTWLLIADYETQGIHHPDCLTLSQLHSDAVDYPKSGQPVPLGKIPKLRFRVKPDWNAPETVTQDNKDYYQSPRAIGRLFREINLPALRVVQKARRFQRRQMEDGQHTTVQDILDDFNEVIEPDEEDVVWTAVQDRILGFIAIGQHDETLIAEIWELFESYVSQLQTICASHTLSHSRSAMLTEEEAVVGTIVAKCSQPRKRKDLMSKMREQTAALVQAVGHQLAGEDGTLAEKSLERGWIAFRLARIEDEHFGAKSFAWIALAEIFEAIRTIEESEGML